LLFIKTHKDSSLAIQIGNKIKNAITNVFSPSAGVTVAGALGATFGIPIGFDLDGIMGLYRKGDDIDDGENSTVNIVLKRFAKVTLGFDVGYRNPGVRAGFNMGGGRRNLPLGSDFEAEANVEVKGEAFTGEAFEFPLVEGDIASVTLLDAILSPLLSLSPTANIAMTITKGLLAKEGLMIDPDRYMTDYKLQMGVFAAASASASVKLKLFENNEQRDRWQGLEGLNTAGQKAKQNHKTGSLLSFRNFLSGLSLKGGLNGRLEISVGGGFEYKAVYDTKTVTTFELEEVNDRIPKSVKQTLFVEGSLGGRVMGHFLSSSGGGSFNTPGLGVKIGIDYTDQVNENEPGPIIDFPSLSKFETTEFIPYSTYGQWDFYAGSASEYAVVIRPLAFLTYLDSTQNNEFSFGDLFYKTFESVVLKKRFAIKKEFGKKIKSRTEFDLTQQATKNLVNAYEEQKKLMFKTLNVDVTWATYLDVEFTLTTQTIVHAIGPMFNCIRLHIVDVANNTQFLNQVIDNKSLKKLPTQSKEEFNTYLAKLNEILVAQLNQVQASYPITSATDVMKTFINYISNVDSADTHSFIKITLKLIVLHLIEKTLTTLHFHSEIGIQSGFDAGVGTGLKARVRAGLAVKKTKDVNFLETDSYKKSIDPFRLDEGILDKKYLEFDNLFKYLIALHS